MKRSYDFGAILTAREMTDYALRHKLRGAWGIRDEDEIKETISFAADYWRLELIDISEFAHVCDPDYKNKSMKAYPIVHYFNSRAGQAYCQVLDGMHRIGMARARGETEIRAWVGHDGDPAAARPASDRPEPPLTPPRAETRPRRKASARAS